MPHRAGSETLAGVKRTAVVTLWISAAFGFIIPFTLFVVTAAVRDAYTGTLAALLPGIMILRFLNSSLRGNEALVVAVIVLSYAVYAFGLYAFLLLVTVPLHFADRNPRGPLANVRTDDTR